MRELRIRGGAEVGPDRREIKEFRKEKLRQVEMRRK